MKKLSLLSALIFVGLSVTTTASASTFQGRIVEAAKCSQKKDAGYFSTKQQRDLKCQKIKLPASDVCDASLTDDQRPSKIKMIVPGLDDHRSTKSGSVTFTKGGVIVYESTKRSGAFKNKKKLFSDQSVGDQLEFLLTRRSGGYELQKIALYLDHKEKGDRLFWTEYTCNF